MQGLLGLGNVGAVFRFEWRRSLSVSHMAWWFMLMLFPIFIVSLIRMAPGDLPRDLWSAFLFVLLPMMVGMLGTFLWTTPAVSAELERQSWVYLAVRPGGRSAVLVGKYLTAVTWVLPAALISLTVCVLVAKGEGSWRPANADQVSDAWRIWSSLASIICLSCPAYAALYLLIGTLFTKRSMVIAVIYTLVFELAVSLVPAIINKLTIQYRLRALVFDWTDLDVGRPDNFIASELISNAPASTHVMVLIGYTLGLLVAAIWLIRHREYTVGVGGDI